MSSGKALLMEGVAEERLEAEGDGMATGCAHLKRPADIDLTQRESLSFGAGLPTSSDIF